MAFKMTGFSAFTRKTGNVDPTKKLLPTEHVDTDRDIPTNRADINDRINFIKEDITNQDGIPTKAQENDLAALNKALKKFPLKN